MSNAKRLLCNPGNCWLAAIILLAAELVLNTVIVLGKCAKCKVNIQVVIQSVKYTEIDWIAYMQEVEGVLNGTYDYR